jgi:hypothetical protein
VQAAHKAARARIELAIVIPLIAVLLLANEYRREIFGLDLPVRVFTAVAPLILGWRSGSPGSSRARSPSPARSSPLSSAWRPSRRSAT